LPELSYHRRMLVLVICAMSLLIVGMDVTIVNVALPDIQTSMHAGIDGLQWVIDAYSIVLASLLLLSGSTADRVGRRRTFQIGLVTFGLGSLLCSLAPSLTALVLFRMLQAVGGSMLNPVAMSIIRNVFSDPKERARAVGIWGAVFGVSMALGPVLGGALTDAWGWRAIFWVNVPIVIAAIVLTQLFVPESKAPRARRPDPIGQVLIIVSLASLTYAIIEGPGKGWGSPEIIGFFALAAVAIAVFIPYEFRRPEPLIDPRFFRSAPFSGATIIAICSFAMMGGFLFTNVLYLQEIRGLDALHAGLYLLPTAAMSVMFAPVSGRLIARRGTRLPLLLAGIGLVAGAVMLTRLSASTPTLYVLGTFLVFGIGNAMVNPPITNTAISGMPPAQAGVAAGVASTSRQVGSALGVAIAGSIVNSGIRHHGYGAAFLHSSAISWWVAAGFGAVVLILGLITSGSWAHRTAQDAAQRLSIEPATTGAGVR
jgi:EmrB/QacA subfamily drug resistance transporter